MVQHDRFGWGPHLMPGVLAHWAVRWGFSLDVLSEEAWYTCTHHRFYVNIYIYICISMM